MVKHRSVTPLGNGPPVVWALREKKRHCLWKEIQTPPFITTLRTQLP